MFEYVLSQSVHVLVLGVVLWYLGGCYATGVFAALLDDDADDLYLVLLGFAWPLSLPLAIVIVLGLFLFQRVGGKGVGLGSRLRNLVS